MLTEFSEDKTRKPLVTYTIILTSVILTLVNMYTTNYDDFLLEEEIVRMFLLPFHHGFDFSSSVIHLLFSCVFFYLIGKPVEKILGSFDFFMLLISSYVVYVGFQFAFNIQGFGLTPIIYAMSAYTFASLAEAKAIKPRVIHETLYNRLNAYCVAFMLTSLLLFSFLPIYFDVKKTELLKGIFEGNFMHIVLAIFGLVTLVFLRRKIKMSLFKFNKRKRFKKEPKNKEAVFASLIFPVGIIIVLIIFR